MSSENATDPTAKTSESTESYSPAHAATKATVSNKTYDMMKTAAQLLLPALGTLYVAIATIWGLPYAEQVAATILAVNVFLGVVLKILSVKYERSGAAYDGAVVQKTAPDGTVYADLILANYEDPVDALKQNRSLTFKVLDEG